MPGRRKIGTEKAIPYIEKLAEIAIVIARLNPVMDPVARGRHL